jgi:hypothetical protein
MVIQAATECSPPNSTNRTPGVPVFGDDLTPMLRSKRFAAQKSNLTAVDLRDKKTLGLIGQEFWSCRKPQATCEEQFRGSRTETKPTHLTFMGQRVLLNDLSPLLSVHTYGFGESNCDPQSSTLGSMEPNSAWKFIMKNHMKKEDAMSPDAAQKQVKM